MLSGSAFVRTRKSIDSGRKINTKTASVSRAIAPIQSRAHHQSGQRRRENRPQQFPRKAPLPGDPRSDIADGLGIEAIEEHHQAVQNDDPVLDGPNVTGRAVKALMMPMRANIVGSARRRD